MKIFLFSAIFLVSIHANAGFHEVGIKGFCFGFLDSLRGLPNHWQTWTEQDTSIIGKFVEVRRIESEDRVWHGHGVTAGRVFKSKRVKFRDSRTGDVIEGWEFPKIRKDELQGIVIANTNDVVILYSVDPLAEPGSLPQKDFSFGNDSIYILPKRSLNLNLSGPGPLKFELPGKHFIYRELNSPYVPSRVQEFIAARSQWVEELNLPPANLTAGQVLVWNRIFELDHSFPKEVAAKLSDFSRAKISGYEIRFDSPFLGIPSMTLYFSDKQGPQSKETYLSVHLGWGPTTTLREAMISFARTNGMNLNIRPDNGGFVGTDNPTVISKLIDRFESVKFKKE